MKGKTLTEEAAPERLFPWPLHPIAGGAEEPPEDTPAPDPGAADPQEGTPAEPEGSPAPEIDWESDDNPYRKRYGDLQPEYTRASQRAAQLEQIMEAARQGDADALDYLGLEPADTGNDDEDPYLDESDRLDRLEQTFAQQQAQAQEAERQARLEAAARDFYDEEFTRLDPENEWDDEYRQLVVAVADDYLDQDNLPNLEQADKVIQGRIESEKKKWVESKRAPQAPSGASPSQNIDLDDPEQRREYIYNQLAAGRAAEQGL